MYKLELTDADMRTIDFVGYRYCWSDILLKYCNEGLNKIPEHKAWDIIENFVADTDGGHSMFPMLDPASELYEKLLKFYESID